VFIAELQPEPAEILARLGAAPGAVPAERIFKRIQDALAAATRQVHESRDLGVGDVA
jgi:hypothetical protein